MFSNGWKMTKYPNTQARKNADAVIPRGVLIAAGMRQWRGTGALVFLHISELHIYTLFSSKSANDHYRAGVPRPLKSGNTPPAVGLYCAHSKVRIPSLHT
jgi:hypothetical protein